MTEEKFDKNKQLPLPKIYTEFYPKNYSKKDKVIKVKHCSYGQMSILFLKILMMKKIKK